MARLTLADFARRGLWIDGSSHRVLLRWGSVESLRWGGGVNVLGVGPWEGTLVQADMHCALGRSLEWEASLTSLVWARKPSVLAHLPVAHQGRVGIRWAIGR